MSIVFSPSFSLKKMKKIQVKRENGCLFFCLFNMASFCSLSFCIFLSFSYENEGFLERERLSERASYRWHQRMLASSEACQQTLHSLTRSHCKLKETNPRARSWSHHVFFVLSLGTLICAPSRERRKHVSDHLIVSTGFMAGGTFLLAGIIKMPTDGQQKRRSWVWKHANDVCMAKKVLSESA